MSEVLRKTIEAIANESKLMTMHLSLRDIKKMVNKQLGISVSPATIASILREIGYETENRKSNWVEKKGKVKK